MPSEVIPVFVRFAPWPQLPALRWCCGHARAVIALGFDALMPQRVNRPSRLLTQTTSALTNKLMYSRLAAAESDGMRLLRIFPRLERRVGLFDSAAMPQLVAA